MSLVKDRDHECVNEIMKSVYLSDDEQRAQRIWSKSGSHVQAFPSKLVSDQLLELDVLSSKLRINMETVHFPFDDCKILFIPFVKVVRIG